MQIFSRYITAFIMITLSSVVYSNTQIKAVTEHFPPYQIVKNNEVISGKGYQVVNSALAQTDFDYDIEVMPWARAYELALKEPNVVIFSIARTQPREHLFHWLRKLGDLQFYFYSPNDKHDIKINSIHDARKYIQVAVRGSYEADKLRELGFRLDSNLVLVNDFEHAWLMVNKGRAQAIYASIVPPKILHASLHGFKRHPLVIDELELYVAVGIKTDQATVDKLANALNKVSNLSNVRSSQ